MKKNFPLKHLTGFLKLQGGQAPPGSLLELPVPGPTPQQLLCNSSGVVPGNLHREDTSPGESHTGGTGPGLEKTLSYPTPLLASTNCYSSGEDIAKHLSFLCPQKESTVLKGS